MKLERSDRNAIVWFVIGVLAYFGIILSATYVVAERLKRVECVCHQVRP